MSYYRIDKLGIPNLSCGLDKLPWTGERKTLPPPVRKSNLRLTVFTLKTSPEHTKTGDHNSATDLKKVQMNDNWTNQVLKCVRYKSLTPLSHLQGLPRIVWKPWNLFNDLTICHVISCPKHESLKTSQMVFQQILPPALVQDILLFPHSDHTSAHAGVTKALDKSTLPFLFAWSLTRCWKLL